MLIEDFGCYIPPKKKLILILDNNQQNKTQMSYFEADVLERMRECSGFDRTFLLADNLYMAVSTVFYSVQHGSNTVDVGVMKLLQLSVKEKPAFAKRNGLKA